MSSPLAAANEAYPDQPATLAARLAWPEWLASGGPPGSRRFLLWVLIGRRQIAKPSRRGQSESGSMFTVAHRNAPNPPWSPISPPSDKWDRWRRIGSGDRNACLDDELLTGCRVTAIHRVHRHRRIRHAHSDTTRRGQASHWGLQSLYLARLTLRRIRATSIVSSRTGA